MSLLFIRNIIDKIIRNKVIKNGNANFVKCASTRKIKQILINGDDNSFISKSPNTRILINIYGNNNKILIEDDVVLNNDCIYIGTPDSPADNCNVVIGKKTSSNGFCIRLGEDGSEVVIGENCIFSSGINMWCTDSHSILDFDNKLLNRGMFIKIGNHVWCGMDVKINKNVEIADNNVIGWGSIVTKSTLNSNVAIAGNPARIIKQNIKWDIKRPQFFIKSEG